MWRFFHDYYNINWLFQHLADNFRYIQNWYSLHRCIGNRDVMFLFNVRTNYGGNFPNIASRALFVTHVRLVVYSSVLACRVHICALILMDILLFFSIQMNYTQGHLSTLCIILNVIIIHFRNYHPFVWLLGYLVIFFIKVSC